MATANRFLSITVTGDRLDIAVADHQGTLIGALQRNLPDNGPCEPLDWWRALRTGTKDLLRRTKVSAGSVRAIALAGNAERVVCLDQAGNATCPSGHLDDDALSAANEEIHTTCGPANLLNITGKRSSHHSLAAHLLWIRDHAKRSWHDLHQTCFDHDFLRFKLSDSVCMDPASAGHSMLFNVKQGMWSKQLCNKLAIDPSCLPPVHPGRQIGGRVSKLAARESGLQEGTPIILGGSCLSAAAVGCGVIRPHQALIEIGGSGRCFIVSEGALRDRAGQLSGGRHCLADTWTLESRDVITAHGIDWLLREVATSENARSRRAKRPALDVLAEQAAETPPGAEGLFFIQPEDLAGRGAFVGLDYHHHHGHMIRAVLESGALDLQRVFLHLDELEVPIEEVLLIGPGAHNRLWAQIVTDAIDRPATAIIDEGLCSQGLALMAATATGCQKSLETACKAIDLKRQRFRPRKAATSCYTELRPRITALTSAIAKCYS